MPCGDSRRNGEEEASYTLSVVYQRRVQRRRVIKRAPRSRVRFCISQKDAASSVGGTSLSRVISRTLSFLSLHFLFLPLSLSLSCHTYDKNLPASPSRRGIIAAFPLLLSRARYIIARLEFTAPRLPNDSRRGVQRRLYIPLRYAVINGAYCGPGRASAPYLSTFKRARPLSRAARKRLAPSP